MNYFMSLNARLAGAVLSVASACLALLGLVVIYGVIMRYGFNSAPAYVEQVALLLVISVAMFGAAAGVHDAGHIGLDSVVKMLPLKAQFLCLVVVQLLTLGFATILVWGSIQMGLSTHLDQIPTLGISEAYRYLPAIISGSLIIAFSFENLIALFISTPSAE